MDWFGTWNFIVENVRTTGPFIAFNCYKTHKNFTMQIFFIVYVRRYGLSPLVVAVVWCYSHFKLYRCHYKLCGNRPRKLKYNIDFTLLNINLSRPMTRLLTFVPLTYIYIMNQSFLLWFHLINSCRLPQAKCSGYDMVKYN